jgi:hypothetical protein
MRTEQQQQPVVPFLLRCADWLSIRIGRLLLGPAIHPPAPLPFLLFTTHTKTFRSAPEFFSFFFCSAAIDERAG